MGTGNMEFDNVQLDVEFSQASERDNITSNENIALSFGKLSTWFEALVPEGGSSGQILGWKSSGTAKWINSPTIPTVNDGIFSIKKGSTNIVTFSANQSSNTDLSFVEGSNVTITPNSTNRTVTIGSADEKVKVDKFVSTTQTDYLLTGAVASMATTAAHLVVDNADGVASARMRLQKGTTDTIGQSMLMLGNNIASGTSNNMQGMILMYSSSDKYGKIVSESLMDNQTWTLPDKTGTIAMTSDIPTVNNGKLTIKGGTTSVAEFTANQSSNTNFSIVAGSNVTVTPDAGNSKITIASSDTKVTSATNHYTPSRDTSADKTASASGATAAWSIDVVKGVTLQTDGKGHVTGISVTSGKIPANPNTDRYVNSAAFADDSVNKAASPVKMTLTRAGSDSVTIVGNIPKVSSSSAGVAPKGAAVSTQSQSTKFLREDGSWSAPSYTSIPSNNVTGSGTSGYLTKWNGANAITNGPQLGSSTTTFLRNDGSWATPINTDTKVNVTLATTSKAYLLGTTATPTSTAQAVTSVADTGVYLGTTSGSLYATKFVGALQGNADSATTATKATQDGDGNTISSTYLKLSGGTMTGTLTTKASQYEDAYSGALNMNNSNIYGVNAIYTADVSDNAAEGIHFYRDSTHVDTLWMSEGSLLFVPYRELGASTTAANSQKVARFTTNPTTDQVVITDGTTGGIKSSGSTITTTPSGKVNSNWGTASDRTTIVTKGWMSYWDGSYDGSASNLTYCNKGAFGTIVTKNAGDYVPNTQAGVNAAINLLSTGSSTPGLADYYVSQYANGGTTTTSYHRRPISALWNAFKELVTLTTTGTGNAVTAISIANDGDHNRKITVTKGSTFSLSTHTHSNYLGAKSDGTYYGMASPTGADNVWIRTTSQGIIPYQQGNAGSGHNYLGTSSWYFAHAYIDTVHGSLDGTATQAIKLRSAAARTDSSVDTADTTPYQKYWVKIASCYTTEKWADLESLWAVNDVYGNRQGILKVRARVEGTAGTFGNARTIRWIVADSDIDVNRFAIVCYNNRKPDGTTASGTATVELWWKSTYQYASFSFVLLDETRRLGKQPNDWVLYDTSTYGQAALPTTGSITYSVAATILNSTTGNAATATTAANANVTVTDVPSSSTTTSDSWYTSYGLLFAQNPNTTQANTLRKSHNLRFYHNPNGTADTVGVGELIVGNNTASGTAGNMRGQLCLYSSSSSYITMTPTATSSPVILTLPAVTGTVPSFTTTPTSGRIVITDGTGGGIKSSGYTIATSVPSGAVFTDHITTVTSSGSGNAVTAISADANGALTVTKGSTFSLSTHTHNYAGSSSAGGAATSANKLNTNAGATNRPVYFSGGVPVQCDAPASGSWFKGVPLVGTNGCMEIGKYIDFHATNASTADYDYRIETSTTAMTLIAGGASNILSIKSSDYTQLSFQTTSSGKAYTSSGIICYPLTTNGMTALFSFGGNLVIGGGEAAKTLYDNDYDTIKTTEHETLYLASDSEEMHLITNAQSYAGRKVLKILGGQLTKSGGSWISARDNAPVHSYKGGDGTSGSFFPAIFSKSKNGGWAIGTLGNADTLYASYTTDTDYSNNTNTSTYTIQFPKDSGTLALTTSNITGTSANVTGTVAIAHGGTGATDRLNALRNLTIDNVGTSATYFLTITDSWGKGGYTKVSEAKTVLGIGATTSSGTAKHLAYYNGENSITDADNIIYSVEDSTKSRSRTILHLVGTNTVGNEATQLVSGVKGVLSYGDGGPQINFSTSATIGGAQDSSIIWTDNDGAGYGASWHFVSNQRDWNVVSKRFHARTSISIGTDVPPVVSSTTATNYPENLYVSGTSKFTYSDFGPIHIVRSGSTWAAGIKFSNSNGLLGAIGMTGNANTPLIRWKSDLATSYTILDTGNTSVTTSGSGNAITALSFSNGTFTATKGSTFSLSTHTHSQYYDSAISRTANTVLAAPNGSNGGATFRKLVAADIPSLNYVPNHGNLNGTIGADSPAADVKTFFMTSSVPTGTSSIGYNTSGNEYTLIFGKGTNAAGYGAVLRFGYDSLYPEVLRVKNGTWESTDWEKISAGKADIAENVSGTVAIEHGGTGSTTRLGALKNLTIDNVGTSATYFLTITTNWAKGGYTSVAQAKTVLGMGTLASRSYVEITSITTVTTGRKYTCKANTNTYKTFLVIFSYGSTYMTQWFTITGSTAAYYPIFASMSTDAEAVLSVQCSAGASATITFQFSNGANSPVVEKVIGFNFGG